MSEVGRETRVCGIQGVNFTRGVLGEGLEVCGYKIFRAAYVVELSREVQVLDLGQQVADGFRGAEGGVGDPDAE